MYKVTEFFETWQMEGCFTGMPVHLLRFSGCNLSCGFCDERGKETAPMLLTLDEIARSVPEGDNLLLTGGEPLLGVDSDLFLFAEEQNVKVYIETNGTIAFPHYMRKHRATVSPKYGHTVNVSPSNIMELKYVVPGAWPDIDSIIESAASILPDDMWDWRFVCFQPQTENSQFSAKNNGLTLAYAKDFKRRIGFFPRLSIQGQRVLGIR